MSRLSFLFHYVNASNKAVPSKTLQWALKEHINMQVTLVQL